MPIRTGIDARGAKAHCAGPLPRGRDEPSDVLAATGPAGFGPAGFGSAGIGSAGIETGSDSSGTLSG